MKTRFTIFKTRIIGAILCLCFISTRSHAQFIPSNRQHIPCLKATSLILESGISAKEEASHPIFSQQLFSVTQHKEKVEVINTSESPNLVDYKLYSEDGGIISEGSFKKDLQIYIGELKAGLYILDIYDGGKTETHKVIIQE